MRPRLRIVLWSVAFWAVWLGIAGLAMTIHGDCGVGATEAEAAACVRAKGWVGIIVFAIGALPYGLMIWRMVKSRKGDS